jgi:tetratricopeptide (TPR) repeat protein
MIGRQRVLAQLRAATEAAIGAGQGQVVLLAGEAGIGKTAVATEAAAEARQRGARVLWASCLEGAGVPGYWPWVQVVRLLAAWSGRVAGAPSLARLVPELAGGAREPMAEVPAEAARFQLFDELSSVLLAEAEAAPLLLVLDDLHWADAASVELLRLLARRLHGAAVLVVGTYRDVGVDLDAPLAELAAASTVLPLAGLERREVAGIMAEIAGAEPDAAVAAEVHRRTGGNPFYVHQVTRLLLAQAAGTAAIPAGVREAVERRLARLRPGCAEVLAVAAVAGPELEPALLARVTGQPAATLRDLLDEAARARVLLGPTEPLGPYRFAHDLFCESIDDGLDAAERARLHLRVAAALEEELAAGGEVAPARLAGHFLGAAAGGAGGEAAAVRWCVLAAEAASARMAHEEAAGHFERALRVLDAAADAAAPRRADLLLELGTARRRGGDLPGARQAYLRAADLARRSGDAERLGRAALGLHAIGTESVPSPFGELVGVLEEAGAALAGADTPLRAMVLASLARELAWTGADLLRASRLAETAVTAARRAGDPATLASCLVAWHNVIWGPGTAGERLALTKEIADLAARRGDRELQVECRLLRVADLLELADPAAHQELAEFIGAAEALRQPRLRYAALARRAMRGLLTGRFGEVERLLAEAVALGGQIGEPDVRQVEFAQLWDLRSAQGRRRELMETLGSRLPPDSPITICCAAMAALEAGRREQAEAVVRELPDLDPSALPMDRSWMVALAWIGELAAGLGNLALCRRARDALAPYDGGAVVIGAAVTFHGAVAHHLGRLEAALERTPEALAHFQRALAAHEQLGARPWALRSGYELASLLLRDPARRAEAAAALAEIAAEADLLGMDELARQARARQSGEAAPPAHGTFRRDGALWTLEFAGKAVRMRDAKGLRDLAALLAVPGQPVHAAELVAASGGGEAGLASLRLGADQVLDERARRQLRTRLTDLEEEIDEAERWADPERAALARDERDALLHELTAAAGLGGRARRLGDQGERARKAVTARIRDVIARVDRVHPALGAHLRASVTTGTFCAYSPASPTEWELGSA